MGGNERYSGTGGVSEPEGSPEPRPFAETKEGTAAKRKTER